MDSDGIRLRYAGILNFAALVVRLMISMGFIIVVTRRLSVEEFGLWILTISLISYLNMPMGLWSYWYPRSIARGVPGSFGTGLMLTTIYLPLALVIYCVVAYGLYLYVTGWGLECMLTYGVLLLAISIILSFLLAIPGTVAPEVYGYSTIVYETLRLPLSYLLVALLYLGVGGALLTVTLALLVSGIITFTLLRARGVKWDGIDFSLAKRWFKGSLIPFTGVINSLLGGVDSILLAFLSRSEVPVAYMAVGYSLRGPIAYGGATSSSLYAKMLRGGSARDVEEVTRLYFAITLFMFTTVLCLAPSLISLLNPVYRDAYWIVFITSVLALIQGVIGIFGSVVGGREEVDLKPDVSVKDYVKSKLFKWSLLSTITLVVGLSIGSILLLIFLHSSNAVLLASAYPIGWLVSWCIFLPTYYHMTKKVIDFKIPWRDIAPFMVAGVCSALCYVLLGSNSIIIELFWRDMPILLTHVIVAGLAYLVISYALSSWFRDFLRAAKRFVLIEVFRVGGIS
ncbi:MAG: hypothetical protein N3F04_05540 [Candidatus Nezhaarchaeota archaeon]|nr:hypothetical protein [Candidatus Nezhaarchaeota archaeon]